MEIKTHSSEAASLPPDSWPVCGTPGLSQSSPAPAASPTRPTSQRCRASTRRSSTRRSSFPFMGIPVLLAGAAIVQFRAGDSRRGWLLAAATATYVVGVLGVTIGGNVPLNDALEAFDLNWLGRADHRQPPTNLRDPLEPLALPPYRSQHRLIHARLGRRHRRRHKRLSPPPADEVGQRSDVQLAESAGDRPQHSGRTTCDPGHRSIR